MVAMTVPGANRRGGPLVSLGLVLGCWVVLRLAMWEAPLAAGPVQPAYLQDIPRPAVVGQKPADMRLPSDKAISFPTHDNRLLRAPVPRRLERSLLETAVQVREAHGYRGSAARAGWRSADRIVARTMLLAAAYRTEGEMPALQHHRGVGPVAPGAGYAPEVVRQFGRETSAKRWTVDAWALWRKDTPTPLTSGRPSYGRSQAGAVLQYRLAPASGHAPQSHLRVTRALDGASETDVALGASARLLPQIPVRLAAEARVSETQAGTEVRAAAFAVTELSPVTLPAGFTGEAYAQAGYVTGRFATPFVDGQARIARELAGARDFRLTAGGGAWGGAQEDAARLDVGPSAGISFRIGQAHGRVSADYRFRVAGDAEPASGPALTVTAGF